MLRLHPVAFTRRIKIAGPLLSKEWCHENRRQIRYIGIGEAQGACKVRRDHEKERKRVGLRRTHLARTKFDVTLISRRHKNTSIRGNEYNVLVDQGATDQVEGGANEVQGRTEEPAWFQEVQANILGREGEEGEEQEDGEDEEKEDIVKSWRETVEADGDSIYKFFTPTGTVHLPADADVDDDFRLQIAKDMTEEEVRGKNWV